jgi:hypothetical protein
VGSIASNRYGFNPNVQAVGLSLKLFQALLKHGVSFAVGVDLIVILNTDLHILEVVRVILGDQIVERLVVACHITAITPHDLVALLLG